MLSQGGFPIAQQEAPLLTACQLQQRQQQHQHQGWPGRFQPPQKASSGIFASAELADAGGAAGAAWGPATRTTPHHVQHMQHAQQQQQVLAGNLLGPLLGGAAGCDAAERVAFSQMLLQVGAS